MNMHRIAILTTLTCLGAATLCAQEGNAPPPPAEPGKAPPGAFRGPGERGERRGPMTGNPMVERWLQRLQHEQPEEHARLVGLRDGNPEEFHREMRRRLRAEISRKIEQEHPAVYQAIQGLPEEEREWLVSRVYGFGSDERGGPRGPGPGIEGGGPPRGPWSNRPDDSEAEVRRLAQSFHQAGSEGEREQIRQTMRRHLAQSFKTKHEERQRELQQMMDKLQEARKFLDERERSQDAIIDRRVEELLSPRPAGPGPTPPPPAPSA